MGKHTSPMDPMGICFPQRIMWASKTHLHQGWQQWSHDVAALTWMVDFRQQAQVG